MHLIDEEGIGAGASGVSGGLLHPYSPKGRPPAVAECPLLHSMSKSCHVIAGKLLWQGEEGWRAALHLLQVAEEARQNTPGAMSLDGKDEVEQPIARHR